MFKYSFEIASTVISELLFTVGTYRITDSFAKVPRWKGGDITYLGNFGLHLVSAWQSFLARALTARTTPV